MTTEQKIELWGEDLYNAFADNINEDGSLTSDWAEIIERKYPDHEFYDKLDIKKSIYLKMYNIDFEDNKDERLITPKTDYKIKVFRIFTEEYEYVVSSYNQISAFDFLRNEYDVTGKKVIEIPESEWDLKNIKIHEDNDFSKEPFYISIREGICENEQTLISTNDFDLIS